MDTSISSEEGIKGLVAPRPMVKRAVKRRVNRSRYPSHSRGDEVRPAVGTMARTKRLILAAVRVWELKKGIRD